jgi:hypothetical protein
VCCRLPAPSRCSGHSSGRCPFAAGSSWAAAPHLHYPNSTREPHFHLFLREHDLPCWYLCCSELDFVSIRQLIVLNTVFLFLLFWVGVNDPELLLDFLYNL